MITQCEFLNEIGISYTTLKKYHEKGKFLPVWKSPTGKRVYYNPEQVQEFKGYIGISLREFSEKTGVSTSKLIAWNKNGRLPAHRTDINNHLRYDASQIDKYFAGDYDCIKEEGFINRKSLADKLGVSESLLMSWNYRGLLEPDHKTMTKVWQYRPDQIEEAKQLIKMPRKALDKV